MRRGWVILPGALLVLAGALVAWIAVAAAHPPLAHQAYVPQCSDSQYPAARDLSNPLDLAIAPGPDPLHGAHLFIEGPRHGEAAAGIEQLLGIDPTSYSGSYSWLQFLQDLSSPPLSTTLQSHPGLNHDVRLLEKIASEQETIALSLYSGGGGPGAVFAQVQKIFCSYMMADHTPHTVPVFSTFFVYPKGQFCPPLEAILANGPTFRRQINEMAAGTGRNPAIYLLEIDAVGTSQCLSAAARAAWEADLRYEIEQMTALPHTVVYVEAGSFDEAPASYVANMLDAICVVRIHHVVVNVCSLMRGFFTNGTHFNWSINEVSFATKVSRMLQKLIFTQTHTNYIPYYVINTAQNGRGPKLNPDPVRQGIEDLCNPPGRGLGRQQTANTAPTFDGHDLFPRLDAFLWTGVPGKSYSSSCHPGDAPPGVWFARYALELAANANQQLGSGYPSQPY
ncbi:MAG: glycoside hydrolase family 6 protein [Solirubrobacteraceae bacterium]